MRASSRLILPPFRDRNDGDPGLALINERAAGFFVIDSTGQTFSNQVPSTVDSMQRGSTTGVDTNDPSIYYDAALPTIALPGGNNNYVDGGASRTYTWATSIALIMDFGSVGVQVISGNQYPCALGPDGSNRMMLLQVTGTTSFSGAYNESNSGVNKSSGTSSAVPVGTRYVRWLVGTGGVSIDYSNDKSSWTNVASSSGVAATTTTSWNLRLGNFAYGTSNCWSGQPVGCSVELDGAEVERIDARDNTASNQTSWTSTYGKTCTIVRPTSTGLKTIHVPAGKYVAQGDGVDDYFQLPASCTPTFTATTGGYTCFTLVRRHNSSPAGRIISASNGATSGMRIENIAGTNRIYVGGSSTVFNTSGVITPSEWAVVGGRANTGSLAAFDSVNGINASETDITGTGSYILVAPRLLVNGYAASTPQSAEVAAHVTFNEALTDDEITDVMTYLESLV